MDLTLIIFAALALFLSYRLFNVLGTRGGHEPDEQDRPVLRPVGAGDAANDGQAPSALQVTPREDLPPWAQTVRETTPTFEPKAFLEGAKQAYEMIVQAYASGELQHVRSFIDPEVLRSFEVAIEGRDKAGQTVDLTFVGVDTPEVIAMDQGEGHYRAELKFRSEQIRAVRDENGKVIEGSEEQATHVVDRWIFARPVKTRDPNWILVATQGSDA
jgi:predicted lipid-binding transport protein (Tim44 family)